MVSPVLVGRAGELDQLRRTVLDPPAVVLVEGEAGIGKTRLISELRPPPGREEYRLVLGACRRIRDPLPLAPLLDAIGELVDVLPSVRLSPLAGALRPLLPEAAHVLPPAPEPLPDRAAQRHRIFRALAELLDAVGPTVLVVDDLHWADDQTVDFLSYLLGDPPAGLALVLTCRGEEVDPAVRALATAVPATTGRAHLVLAALDDHDTGALAAAILGVEQVSAEFASQLRERTSGVPFAVEEVLALLRARGAISPAADSGTVTLLADDPRDLLGEVGVPGVIRDSALERVSRLASDPQAVVDAVAVLHAPGSVAALAGMLNWPDDRVVSALGPAVECGMLTDRDGMVSFRHLLAAQAIYDAIHGARRSELHERAAAVLGRQDPVPLGQLAHQLKCAGRLGEWAAVAEQAAQQAVRLGHDAEAVRLLVEVLRGAPPQAIDHGRLAVMLARAAAETARPPPAVVDLVTQALNLDLPRGVRGELRFRLALLRERAGADPATLRQLLANAVDDLDGRPDLQAWAMIGLGLPVVPGVPLSEHRAWLHRALRILPSVTDRGYEVLLLGKVAMVFAGIGDPTWRGLADRMVARTNDSPRRRREVNAFMSVGIEACHAGHLPVAARLLKRGRDGAVAYDSEKLQLRIGTALAVLDYCRGRWDGLAERAGALIDQRADHAFFRGNAEVVAGCLALARGDLDRAQELLTDATERLTRHGAIDVLPMSATATIRLALGRDDPHEALAAAERLLAALARVPFLVSAVRALPAVSEVLTRCGDLDRVRDLASRWEQAVRGLDAPLAPAAMRHARGFLLAASGEPAKAARAFAGAADRYAALQGSYEAAQAREQAAYATLAGGGAGGQLLRDALTAYGRLGATWDFARAARIARQHGVTVPARHRGGARGYGRELSPRERLVAELAAGGRTNKEIATELFVSPETVKTQLRAVMRKLGVRSRVVLAHHLPSHRH